MKGIKIINNSSEKATIIIDGYIGDEDWYYDDRQKEPGTALTPEQLRQEFSFIAQIKASIIDVKIMSLGGDVHCGLVMHDMLKEHKAVINTMGYGIMASAATIIHQAGTNRYISKNALSMVHKASMCCCGNENDFIAAQNDLKTVDATLKQIYIDNGVQESVINDLFEVDNGNGKYMSAKEFIDLGFADGYIPDNLDEPINLKNIDKKILKNLNIKLPENLQTEDPKNTLLDKFLSNPVEFFQNIINPKPNPMNQKIEKISDILNKADIKNENGVVSLSAANFEKLLDSLDQAKSEKETAVNDLATKTTESQNAFKAEQDAHAATKNQVTEKENDLKVEQDAHTATKNVVTEKETKITELTNLLAKGTNPTDHKAEDANAQKTDWSGCPHMQEED